MAGLYEQNKVAALRITEVGNTISVAESLAVPFQALLPTGPAPMQMIASYPAQVYPRRGFDGLPDGTDHTTGFNSTNQVAIQATGMWLRSDGYIVGKIANLTATGGIPRKAMVGKQKKDDGIIFAQMRERQLLSTMDIRLGTAVDGYRSRGAVAWLIASLQSVLPVDATVMPTSSSIYTGAIADLTPTAFETVLRAMYAQKRAPVDVTNFCGIALKSRMSKWTQKDTDVSGETLAVRYNQDVDAKAFAQIVDTFAFDAGMVRNVLSAYLACDAATGEDSAYTPRSGLLVDLDMWELRELQGTQLNEYPNLGGGERGDHDAVYMLALLNGLGQGAIYPAS
jgi:hypothetical protein